MGASSPSIARRKPVDPFIYSQSKGVDLFPFFWRGNDATVRILDGAAAILEGRADASTVVVTVNGERRTLTRS